MKWGKDFPTNVMKITVNICWYIDWWKGVLCEVERSRDRQAFFLYVERLVGNKIVTDFFLLLISMYILYTSQYICMFF